MCIIIHNISLPCKGHWSYQSLATMISKEFNMFESRSWFQCKFIGCTSVSPNVCAFMVTFFWISKSDKIKVKLRVTKLREDKFSAKENTTSQWGFYKIGIETWECAAKFVQNY